MPPVSVEALALAQALRTLPVRQRQVIVLHRLVDLPVEEVARTLAIQNGTVKSLLARGRRALAAKLADRQEVPHPMMSDLRERLEELAEAAASPTGPVGAPATTRPAEVTASSRYGPDVSFPPEPGEVLRPAGAPPGRDGEGLVWTMGSELTRCPAGDPDAPKVLLAWGTAAGRTWAAMAKPPRPGERWMCWVEGELQADGSSGVATRHVAVGPLRLTGTQWPGRVIGVVTARAARVRVPEPCQVGRRTLRVAG